ncbi:hypothetical protein AB0J72_45255 [Dactylosporangium sp. NPDC049742]|uniref:hypothetical protein n=1 Tax=Dactylosporangium sp. NPDC049742 TaxID=3154737 RepID=UPI0034346827
MSLRVLSARICAATVGVVASTAVGAPVWASSGTQLSASAAEDIAYSLGRLTSTLCCIAVVVGVVVFLVRRNNRR